MRRECGRCAVLKRSLAPKLKRCVTESQHARDLVGPRAHVLDDWRFHMTLSDSVAGWPAARVDALKDAAEAHFAQALAQPLRCEALCVFVEPSPGAPFELRHRFALAGA